MLSPREMTVIPGFWIRILLTPPRTFICDQTLPRLVLARLMEWRWENWILKALRESNLETLTSAATKENSGSPSQKCRPLNPKGSSSFARLQRVQGRVSLCNRWRNIGLQHQPQNAVVELIVRAIGSAEVQTLG